MWDLVIVLTTAALGAATVHPDVRPPEPVERLESTHFELLATRGTPAAGELAAIAATRERALASIVGLLGVAPPAKLRLVLFPDEATKKQATGHSGLGWGGAWGIAEVYGEVRLDPHHELVHVVMAPYGTPPAAVDEGLAVWVADRLGAGSALDLLGWPGRSVGDVGCELVAAGRAVALTALVDALEINQPGLDARVTYVQSAAWIGDLAERHGVPRLLELFASLQRPTDDAVKARNLRQIARIYGQDLTALERAWRATCVAGAP